MFTIFVSFYDYITSINILLNILFYAFSNYWFIFCSFGEGKGLQGESDWFGVLAPENHQSGLAEFAFTYITLQYYIYL